MLKAIITLVAVIGIAGLVATPAFAAEKAAKEVTITGEGKCAKCMLHETAACQNAIEVQKGKKKQVYYLTQNDVSKSFHENLCSKAQMVTATGTVKKVDGKLELTVTKIELAKQEK
jgi:cytochrome c oxidase assembly protein Cox11